MREKIRIGVIGAGAIFRTRHFPGLAKIKDVEVVAICNRSEESGRKIANDFGLSAEIMTDPHALIARRDMDAVMIGTWPYKHCPFTLEALDSGKHTFVQARMAMNLREAKAMLAKAEETGLATQVCPSPFGFKGDPFIRRLIREGYFGTIYQIYARYATDELCDPKLPLHWRQIDRFSGLNTLLMGIMIESIHRWFGYAESVSAHAETFTKQRPLPGSEEMGRVERPDTVHVLARMENGAQGVFLFSGVTRFGLGNQLEVYGSDGTLIHDLDADTILGARAGEQKLVNIPIPEEEERPWSVEQEFIDAIRTGKSPEVTFSEGVKYMEFTEAVFRSIESGGTVRLPLVD